ncbi:MAG: cadherin-like beta sandwich domain-containing protein, partial [Gammaproteobacteria bacterium]|nr:cadherin-like beta sandwich domain-containing protein [Gammaproteobacteria bacterium]
FCTEGSRYLGGLVGGNTDISTVTHSYANVQVVGGSSVGGLVGLNSGGSHIENSYAIGDVEAIDTTGNVGRSGGLVGFNSAEISNSYATGVVSGSAPKGGLVGAADESSSISDSYWDTELSGIAGDTDNGALRSKQLTAPIAATGIYRNWQLSDWDFGSDIQYPALKNSACADRANAEGCKKLLPGQRLGLQKIAFSPDVTLFPVLRENEWRYDIIIPEGEFEFDFTPFVAAPDALRYLRIGTGVIEDKQKQTYTGDRLNITVGKEEDNFRSHGYSSTNFYFYINMLLTKVDYDGMELNDNDVILLNEGEELAGEFKGGLSTYIRPQPLFSVGAYDEIIAGEHVSYRWRDLTDSGLLSGMEMQQTDLTLKRSPLDFVAADAALSDVVLRFSVVYRETTSNKTVIVRILKSNDGAVVLDTPTVQGGGYGIIVDLSQDPDGVNSSPMLEYQWQTRASDEDVWRDIENATQALYSFADAVSGYQYRVAVNYIDGQGYAERVMSPAVTYLDPNSADVGLKKLALQAAGSSIVLEPPFEAGNTMTTSYRAQVGSEVHTITVIADATHELASISVDGSDFAPGEYRAELELPAGVTDIIITVLAPNGSELSYTVAVMRERSSNANLASLSVDRKQVKLEDCDNDCTATVANSVTAVTVAAEVADIGASVVIDGTPIALISRDASKRITDLAVGKNTFDIVVTAEDRETTKSYALNIIRAVPQNDNANLVDITLVPPSNLLFDFAADVYEYAVSVSIATEILTVTAQASEANAVISIDGEASVSRIATADVNLTSVGQAKIIAIVVTSPDGTVTKTYNLSVVREMDSFARLEKMELSPSDIRLQPLFLADVFNYIMYPPAGISHFRLTPTVSSTDSVTINIASSAEPNFSITASNGIQSDAIPLHITADTMVAVTVTTILDSFDYALTYRINVKRDVDGDGIHDGDDIDDDNDGLIEIHDLEGLNAIRYQLDGSGYVDAAGMSKNTTGCPGNGSCKGYELVADLDFSDDASYRSPANKTIWTTGAGWHPIGSESAPFTSIFNGNGHTISNLRMNRADSDNVALFGVTTATGIFNIGLLHVDIVGRNNVGGLVGINSRGVIANSYAIGKRIGNMRVGGLVGRNGSGSEIINSYTMGETLGTGAAVKIGGLAGTNENAARIVNCYTRGNTMGRAEIGGIVGENKAEIAKCYAIGVNLITPYQ